MRAFETARMRVCSWELDLAEAARRAALRADLAAILTAPVLEHLPPSLALPETAHPVEDWIAARHAVSDVYAVRDRASHELAGLIFLFQMPEVQEGGTVHLGYLFGERFWGRGYASEVVAGVVTALLKTAINAGVSRANPASARVLVKAGFLRDVAASTADMDVFLRS